MVYALNVFNFLKGKENDYRDYSIKAGKIIYSKGGKVISSGWNPIRNMHGDRERRYMIVVEFPSEKIFQDFSPTLLGYIHLKERRKSLLECLREKDLLKELEI